MQPVFGMTRSTFTQTHTEEKTTHTHTLICEIMSVLKRTVFSPYFANSAETDFWSQDVCICEALLVPSVTFLLSALPRSHLTLLCRTCKLSQIWSISHVESSPGSSDSAGHLPSGMCYITPCIQYEKRQDGTKVTRNSERSTVNFQMCSASENELGVFHWKKGTLLNRSDVSHLEVQRAEWCHFLSNETCSRLFLFFLFFLTHC